MAETQTRTSGWQVAGSAAESYEAYLVPALFRKWATALVDAVGVSSGDRVLDVACGTGAVARSVAARVGATGAVTGIDVNPEMLAVAERASAGTSPTPVFRQADAQALPFEDGAFDVVLCQQALQFMPDAAAAVAEMRRVTRDDGRVAFSVLRSLDHHPVYARFADALAKHVGSTAGDMMGSPFALGDREVLRAFAAAAGLRDIEVRIEVVSGRFPSVEEFVWYEAASSPLAGPILALTEDSRRALVEDVEQFLEPQTDDAGVSLAYETHVVTGRR
ncbi:MAG: methyltransferase domain-containing protein [Dehalococcoidia bacterium]|nr:methyltransferase domain-containing protein [Dehalococcoidia bacterium]